jgi:hypothetical protein
MNTTLRTAFAISALALMAACGGGSGVSSVPAPTPAPTTNPATPTTAAKPASNSTADLVAFAKGGETQTVSNDVLSISRDYDKGSVSYTKVAGSNVGLVTQATAGGSTYKVFGDAKPNITVGSADYTGPVEMQYSTTANGAKRIATGDMIVGIDFKNQTMSSGGILSSEQNVIQVFGDGTIANGRISDNDTIIRLRNAEGEFIRDYKGTTDGILVNGANGRDAIVGTLGSTGLNMTGGFVVNEN